MSEHTPGPWQEDDGAISHDGAAIARVYGIDDFLCLDEDADTQALVTECEANARLIAAAPDLLVALSDLSSLCEQAQLRREHGVWSQVLDAARAALAKAGAR